MFDIAHLDVIIVGAGLCGLTAAYQLLKKVPELEVLIIEAKDEIGGRIENVKIETSDKHYCNFDIGAQWISSEQYHIMNLINELQIELIPQYIDGLKISELKHGQIKIYNQCLPPLSLYAKWELNKFIENIEEISQNISFENQVLTDSVPNLDIISLHHYIYQNIYSSSVRNFLEIIIKTTFGLRTNDIPLLNYIAFINGTLDFKNQHLSTKGIGARHFWIKDGAYNLCSRLQEHINKKSIIKNDAVTDITINIDSVIIKTQSNKIFTSPVAIITIPPKDILNINFDPPLTYRRKNILQNSIRSGQLMKFVLTYEKPFWRLQGFSGQIISNNGPILLAYDANYNNCAALIGFIHERYQNNKIDDIRNAMTAQLYEYWGSDALNPTNFQYKIWSNLQAPIFIAIDGEFQYLCKVREHAKRIHFAGSENACYWNGYMNGAVVTGFQAAFDILYIIRPQTITYEDIIFLRPPKRNNNPKRNVVTFNNVLKYIGNVSFNLILSIGILLICVQFLRSKK